MIGFEDAGGSMVPNFTKITLAQHTQETFTTKQGQPDSSVDLGGKCELCGPNVLAVGLGANL